MTSDPSDRRPIAARSHPLSQRVTHALVKWGVSPNTISIWSMVFAAAAAGCLSQTRGSSPHDRLLLLAALVCIVSRLLCNMFDGMVAVETGHTSRLGELYNEVPDRVSDTLILVGAGMAVGGDVIFGFTASLAAMMTAYVRVLGKASGLQHDFCGPFAKQHRMAVINACCAFLALAPDAWWPQMCWPRGPKCPCGLFTWALMLVTIGSLFTSVRRLRRIARQLEA